MSAASALLLARAAGLGRIALGLGVVASPRLVFRLFGLPPRQLNPSGALIARVAGNRDLVLGLALAAAPERRLRPWLQLAVAIDAGDALVSLLSLRDGVGRRPALLSAATGVAAAASEVWALQRLGRGP